MAGSLQATEKEEKEKFTTYIEKLVAEELDEGEQNPIIYGNSPYFACELTGGINRIAFSTADDPFYKSVNNKYYPEVTIVDKAGQIRGVVNPKNKKSESYPVVFKDDIRDPVLKINDDRKITMNLA